MNKRTAILIVALIFVFMLVFGFAEKILAGVGGNTAVVVMYTVIAVVLAGLYIKASKESKKEKAETGRDLEREEKELRKDFWEGMNPAEADELRQAPWTGEIPENEWKKTAEDN